MAEINEIQVGQDVFNIGGSGGGVNYSTTEQDTGLKWINGNAIYQKTIYFNSITQGAWTEISHGISNLAQVVNMQGIAYKSSDNNYWIINGFRDSNLAGTIAVNSTKVLIFTGQSGWSSAYVTIQYTKSA